MNVIIFGATGMIGRGVLLEALDSPAITQVISVSRRPSGVSHDKLVEIEHSDFTDFSPIADRLTNLDACFWCLGISVAGLDEAAYTRITHTFTLAAAAILKAQNPEMSFCFVSGAGTDSSESGSTMWARVKGKTENDLKKMNFPTTVLFRPAFIKPMRGSKPSGTLYTVLYAIIGIFSPLFRAFGRGTSTVEMGKAMIAAAQGKATQEILDSSDINDLAALL